ncbi:hypothetical protein B0H16DRAFT_1465692 [Mycena metata]|uniref:Uncharacterized protein n=1 Tax=Mycena metata TaxID=1033252 RepID=A0AAD7IAC6_9AGAR|nr:hypothetical protein B0H16DRAFT_1465692 [Mycena metata]
MENSDALNLEGAKANLRSSTMAEKGGLYIDVWRRREAEHRRQTRRNVVGDVEILAPHLRLRASRRPPRAQSARRHAGEHPRPYRDRTKITLAVVHPRQDAATGGSEAQSPCWARSPRRVGRGKAVDEAVAAVPLVVHRQGNVLHCALRASPSTFAWASISSSGARAFLLPFSTNGGPIGVCGCGGQTQAVPLGCYPQRRPSTVIFGGQIPTHDAPTSSPGKYRVIFGGIRPALLVLAPVGACVDAEVVGEEDNDQVVACGWGRTLLVWPERAADHGGRERGGPAQARKRARRRDPRLRGCRTRARPGDGVLVALALLLLSFRLSRRSAASTGEKTEK